MAKAKQSDLISMAAIAGIGLFAFVNRDKLMGKLAPASPTPEPVTTPTYSTPAPIIQPVTYVTPNNQAPLDSNIVWTPYGPVQTSNFNPLNSPRAVEIIYRVKYIESGLQDATNEQNKYPAGHPAIGEIEARKNVLRQKLSALVGEYKQMSGGADVPRTGIDLAAYQAYLRSKGWCDPLNGVPCPL